MHMEQTVRKVHMKNASISYVCGADAAASMRASFKESPRYCCLPNLLTTPPSLLLSPLAPSTQQMASL